MARRELVTAAAELLIVNRPSASDLEQIQARWRLHPHDLEALFGAPEKSEVTNYRQYARLSLVWPERNGRRLQLFDLTMLISQSALAVVSHHPSPAASRIFSTWETDSAADQRSTDELLTELLTAVAEATEKTTIEPNPEIVGAIRQLPAALKNSGLDINQDFVQRLALVSHRLAYRQSQPAWPAPTESPGRPLPLHRLARAYALASIGVVVLVVIVIAG